MIETMHTLFSVHCWFLYVNLIFANVFVMRTALIFQFNFFVLFMSDPFKADYTVCFIFIFDDRVVAYGCLHQPHSCHLKYDEYLSYWYIFDLLVFVDCTPDVFLSKLLRLMSTFFLFSCGKNDLLDHTIWSLFNGAISGSIQI